MRIRIQELIKYGQVLKQLYVPGRATNDAMSGDIRVASVQYPVDVEKQNLTLAHTRHPAMGHAAQSVGAVRKSAIASYRRDHPTETPGSSVTAFSMHEQLTIS